MENTLQRQSPACGPDELGSVRLGLLPRRVPVASLRSPEMDTSLRALGTGPAQHTGANHSTAGSGQRQWVTARREMPLPLREGGPSVSAAFWVLIPSSERSTPSVQGTAPWFRFLCSHVPTTPQVYRTEDSSTAF